MRKAWLAGLALVALAASPARGDEWTHQYPVKARPDLHVKSDDGSVRIETSAGSEIDARVTTEGWRIAPGAVTITESQTGDRVDIEVRLPTERSGTGRRSVAVVLRMPKEADLEVHTGDGSPSPAASASRRATGASPPTAFRETSACTQATGRSGPRACPGGSRPTRGTAP